MSSTGSAGQCWNTAPPNVIAFPRRMPPTGPFKNGCSLGSASGGAVASPGTTVSGGGTPGRPTAREDGAPDGPGSESSVPGFGDGADEDMVTPGAVVSRGPAERAAELPRARRPGT